MVGGKYEAGRHRQGRGQDGHRRGHRQRAQVHRADRRQLRRRQLRHVRRAYSAALLWSWPNAASASWAASRPPACSPPSAATASKRPRKDGAAQWSAEDEAAFKAPIRARYETEGDPYFATARLWDDGDHRPGPDPRRAGPGAIAASLNAPIPGGTLRRVPDVRRVCHAEAPPHRQPGRDRPADHPHRRRLGWRRWRSIPTPMRTRRSWRADHRDPPRPRAGAGELSRRKPRCWRRSKRQRGRQHPPRLRLPVGERRLRRGGGGGRAGLGRAAGLQPSGPWG